MNKPNLFIVGAMKAGTRTLHRLLAQHPQVFMCEPGEPTRFVDGESLRRLWPRMHRLGYWRDESRYLRLFDGAGGARVIGESSTNYAKLPWAEGVVERIRTFQPEARIVYLMREPAARAISHYWHAVMHDGETRPPASALGGPGIYRDVSHYAMQLAPWLESFGRERVYTLTIESFDAAPVRSYRALLEWLDLDPGFVPPDLNRRAHVRAAVIWQPRSAWLGRWMNRYALFERSATTEASRLAYYARRMLMRFVDTRAVDLTAVSVALRSAMAPEVGALEALLGRPFPEWRR